MNSALVGFLDCSVHEILENNVNAYQKSPELKVYLKFACFVQFTVKNSNMFNSLSTENQILTFEKQEQECVLHFFLIND